MKRYCDKKIFLSHGFLCLFVYVSFSMSSQGKLLTNHKSRFFMFCKEITLANWNQWIKNKFLSQYCPSKCLVWIRPYGEEKANEPTVDILTITKREQQQLSISSTFYTSIFRTKVFFCQNVTREKLCEALLYEKRSRKMLMKLTPAVP